MLVILEFQLIIFKLIEQYVAYKFSTKVYLMRPVLGTMNYCTMAMITPPLVATYNAQMKEDTGPQLFSESLYLLYCSTHNNLLKYIL